MNWVLPAFVAVLVLLYLRSPIDLIPDAIRPIGLLDDLAVLLGAIWWYRKRRGAATSAPPRQSAENLDPHAVLGVRRGASRQEITHAYREQMKLYHPDRVADLGDELREVAHRKAVEIQRAYEVLSSGSGSSPERMERR
jgi:uncharacterized membrane protein YkvA (DUF1232 family)